MKVQLFLFFFLASEKLLTIWNKTQYRGVRSQTNWMQKFSPVHCYCTATELSLEVPPRSLSLSCRPFITN